MQGPSCAHLDTNDNSIHPRDGRNWDFFKAYISLFISPLLLLPTVFLFPSGVSSLCVWCILQVDVEHKNTEYC